MLMISINHIDTFTNYESEILSKKNSMRNTEMVICEVVQ